MLRIVVILCIVVENVLILPPHKQNFYKQNIEPFITG